MKSKRVIKNVFFASIEHTVRKASAAAGKVLFAGAVAALLCAAPAAANPKYAGIVIDAKSGKVLYGEEADSLRYPASLTKMMTLYLTFEALEAGRIKKSTPVPFSKHAASEPPSKLGVGAGRSISVEQAILSLVTRSANDASTALGEMLGGSEARFAKMMTAKARALGMTRTTYRNANGLPDPNQKTTARDQARLGLALRQHFPQYYDYFSTRSFKFGKQVIGNHNRLLGNVRGVDGIKTGYIRASGFNLVTSAVADGRSIVAVVMGGTSGASRDAQMRRLVAKYMPKASRRGGGNLIAAAPVTAIEQDEIIAAVAPAAAQTQGAFALPDNGPVPDFRYEGESQGMDLAFAAAAEAETSQVPDIAPAEKPMIRKSKGQQFALMAPVPSVDIDTQITNSVPEAAPQAASNEPTPSGWAVQIGATASKEQALTLLEKARAKTGKPLASATPFTMAVASNNGASVFRARFGGFTSQDKAVNACKALKRNGFACWAAQQ